MKPVAFSEGQLEVLDQALQTYIEELRILQRESTFSGILQQRLETALEVRALLQRSEPPPP